MWELRPKSVLPRLGKLLSDPKLTGPQKARIVDILASSDDADAGKTMLGVLRSDAAPEVKARAIDSLKLFLPTKWKDIQKGRELADAIDALLAHEKMAPTGLQLIAAAGTLDRIDTVAKIAADANAPLDTRKEAVRTLGKLKDEKSVAALIKVGSPENPLSIASIQALGELLPSGQKPPAWTSKALDALVQGVNAGDRGTPALKSAALAALAGNRAGTIWLLDAHAKGDLPKELVAEAGRLVRNSAVPGLAEPGAARVPGRRTSSTPRTSRPSPNSRSAPVTRPAARRCGTPASRAPRSAVSVTWFAASAVRSARTSP